jgi:acyl-CoA synthetase (NDP forming)/GNAT superfamily N-acetyltransferase
VTVETTLSWAPLIGSASDVLLADGTVGVVRRITSLDHDDMVLLHEGLGVGNLRMRFFNVSRLAAQEYVEHVTTSCERGLVLAIGLWRQQRLVGLATAELTDRTSAEIAFVVADSTHGLGIATLLLEHMAADARRTGVRRFTAEILVDNSPMLQVIQDAGFAVSRTSEGGAVTIAMDTAETLESLAAADSRDAVSEAASLRPLLSPRAVAVVGARRDGTGIGAAILSAIIDGGFTGGVVAVHPGGAVKASVRTVATFDELSADPPDLVVVAVPPARVVDTVVAAAQIGTRAAVVVTSGFAEMGEEGARLQKQLARAARAHGIRLVGPNCLGLLDNQSEVRLDATFGGELPPTGGLAVASQSGGVGIVVLDTARRIGLGVRHFVSLGNKADVSSNDLLAAWLDDPGVTSAALYLESFGNAAKFARIARAFGERKPLLAVVGGRSGSGQRAGASHTAAAATPAVTVDALFTQAGVIGCSDADELAHTALLMTEQPLPDGDRVAVIGNAGGLGVLAADALAEAGLSVPAFSDGLRAQLVQHVAATVGTSNPVDVGAGGSAQALGETLGVLLDSPEVDSVLLALVRTRTMDWPGILEYLADVRRHHPGKPVVGVLLGDDDHHVLAGATALPTLGSAVEALAHAVRYAEWRRQPRETLPALDLDRAETVSGWARSLVESNGPAWIGPAEVRTLFAPYGAAPSGTLVQGAEAALVVAQEVGLPVALKVADPAVVHKTELGLVRPGLTTVDEVRTAAKQMAEVMHDDLVDLLVQPMVSGTEVAVGIVRDPGLGPLVMVAAGGTATDLWEDRCLLMAPVTRLDATRAVRSLRIWPLLSGYRGQAPADVESLVDLVVSVGSIAREVPELAELDLNPVLVGPSGCVLVDVKARLAPAEPFDSGVPRRLRL